jgi:hypothetical protein
MNNLNLNIIKKKFINVLKEKLKHNSPNNIVNYCMKYQNNIFNKFAKISNNYTNNLKIAFKTNNILINHINNRTKNFTKNSLFFKMLEYINLNVTVINFIEKINRNFKIRCN